MIEKKRAGKVNILTWLVKMSWRILQCKRIYRLLNITKSLIKDLFTYISLQKIRYWWRRQEELLLIEQQRQELNIERQQIAQIRSIIDQQKYDLEVRQNKMIEYESLIPSARELRNCGITLELILPYLSAINEREFLVWFLFNRPPICRITCEETENHPYLHHEPETG